VSSGQLQVLLHHLAPDQGTELTDAYHRVSAELAPVPGMLGNELLRSLTQPGGFVVVSRWADIDAFTRWEQGPGHRDATAPLRPYRDASMSRPFGIYQVDARY